MFESRTRNFAATNDGELFGIKPAILVEIRELPNLAQLLSFELGVDKDLARLLAGDGAVGSHLQLVEYIVVLGLMHAT